MFPKRFVAYKSVWNSIFILFECYNQTYVKLEGFNNVTIVSVAQYIFLLTRLSTHETPNYT